MPDECANPLLLQWLKEWMEEAKERNSKGYTIYKKAYMSVKACPLKFHHPSEAQQLNGLGPKLCARLADKLKAYCDANGLPVPEKAVMTTKRTQANEEDVEHDRPAKKQRKAPPYVPKLRSGPYALLLALATLDQEGTQALSKTDLIEVAQPFCDSSFTAPSDPTKFFTAWNSMKTLESKELVCTKGHPAKRYYLSDDGWEVALRIKAVEGGASPSKAKSKANLNKLPTLGRDISGEGLRDPPLRKKPSSADSIMDICSSPELPTYREPKRPTVLAETLQNGRATTHSDCIVLPSGSFEVKLVLDSREIRTKTDRDYIAAELKKQEVTPVIRSLPLGDVLWVAEVKPRFHEGLKAANPGDDDEGNTEIVLEHIMERKRLDDLIGSIKDGRFHEQKFRLRKAGIKHVTYVIEDYSISAERSDKYGEAVESAMTAMQVVSDIFVKQTSKLDDTIRYLARMTRTLQKLFEDKEIYVIPSSRLDADSYLQMLDRLREQAPANIYGTTFTAFASMCDKSDTMTLRDVYLKMLMCTRGVTGEKAIEIQKIWSTPRALIEAFEALPDIKGKENMISDRLGNAIPRKKVARTLSAKIAEIWV